MLTVATIATMLIDLTSRILFQIESGKAHAVGHNYGHSCMTDQGADAAERSVSAGRPRDRLTLRVDALRRCNQRDKQHHAPKSASRRKRHDEPTHTGGDQQDNDTVPKHSRYGRALGIAMRL
jgi:hypothetical protein